jgi:hypothetical protein
MNARHRRLIALYIEAKDRNRPELMRRAFAPDARLETCWCVGFRSRTRTCTPFASLSPRPTMHSPVLAAGAPALDGLRPVLDYLA